MNHKNKNAIQSNLAGRLKTHRKKLGISQEAMARKLCVSVRSYIDLEHGLYGFSATTLVYFLSLLAQEEQVEVLAELRGLLP